MAVYTYEPIYNLANSADFRSLYDQSFPEFEKGTWDWRFGFREYMRPKGELETNTTYEEKYDTFVAFCQAPIDASDNTISAIIYKDDIPIHFTLLTRTEDKLHRGNVMVSLNGRDANASKSWMYDAEFKNLNMLIARDYYGLTEHAVECLKNSPSYNHYAQLNGDNVQGVYTWYIESSEAIWFDQSLEIAYIVFQYPTSEQVAPLATIPWRS